MDSSSRGLVIDLNKYRPGRSLKAYLDAGVDGFNFRIGGPFQWVEGNWKYQEDPTWRPYMDQAKKLGIVDRCGGYIVHNPFEDWKLQGVVSNVHMNLLNQWTSGGYMPGSLILDHEVAECWRGGTKVVCTPYNVVQSLASVTEQIWKIFKKVPVVYTGRWFMDKYARSEHVTYLDNINRLERNRPMWYAGYPHQEIYGEKVYTNARQAVDDLPSPSAAYVGNVLQCGSYSLADLWQFTDRLKVKAVMLDGSEDKTGVDASVTWGTWADYCAAVGIKATAPKPPAPDPDPQPEQPDVAALTQRVQQLERRVNLLLEWLADAPRS